MTSLKLLQLVSPALPVGAFSYSEGLEWLIQTGKIKNQSNLVDWIEAELLRGQIRIEAASQRSIRKALTTWSIEKSDNSKEIVKKISINFIIVDKSS